MGVPTGRILYRRKMTGETPIPQANVVPQPAEQRDAAWLTDQLAEATRRVRRPAYGNPDATPGVASFW